MGGPQWRPDVPMGWDPTSPNVLNGIPAPPMAPRCPRGMGPRCPQHHSDVHMGWDRGAIQVSPWGGTQMSPVAPRRPHGMAADVPIGTQMSPWDGPRCPRGMDGTEMSPRCPHGMGPRCPRGMGPRCHPGVPMGWPQMSPLAPRCPHGMDADVPIGTQTSPWDGCRCPHWHPGVPMGWPQMSMWDGWDRGVTQTSPWDGTQMSPLAPRRPHGMAPDVHVGWDRGVTQTSP